jgi:hypothetical protein
MDCLDPVFSWCAVMGVEYKPGVSHAPQIDMVTGLAHTHKLRAAAANEPTKPRPRMVRLGKEIAGLASELPLHPSSSVFVRVDEADIHLWKALITGAPLALCFDASQDNRRRLKNYRICKDSAPRMCCLARRIICQACEVFCPCIREVHPQGKPKV